MLQIYHENNLVKVQLSDILMLMKVYIFIYSSHKRFQASVWVLILMSVFHLFLFLHF